MNAYFLLKCKRFKTVSDLYWVDGTFKWEDTAAQIIDSKDRYFLGVKIYIFFS